jgi:hypothetical protein
MPIRKNEVNLTGFDLLIIGCVLVVSVTSAVLTRYTEINLFALLK